MMTTLLAIARIALLESLRQPVYLVILMLCALTQTLNTWISAFSMGFRSVPGEATGDSKMLFDVGLASVFVLGLFLASFVATSVMSREIERKTVLTVVSKPIPRPLVVIGKYIGVAVAMAMAVVIMLVMLQLGLRHGVLSNASDKLDWPVILFGVGSLVLALGIGALGNYLFNWNFSQTAVLCWLPLILVAYIIVLFVSKDWKFQPLLTDFKPEVTKACFGIGLGLLVLSAVAAAASTRLGQVMTVVVLFGVFLLGLLTNYFFAGQVSNNPFLGRIEMIRTGDGRSFFELAGASGRELAEQRLAELAEAQGETPSFFYGFREDRLTMDRAVELRLIDVWDVLELAPRDTLDARRSLFLEPGATYRLELETALREPVRRGDAFYYGPSSDGLGMLVGPYEEPSGRTDIDNTDWVAGTPSALVVTGASDLELTVRHIGSEPVRLERPPVPGDYVFTKPTTINPVPAAIWSILPNMQVFWLSDAVTQAVPIPWSHVGLLTVYAAFQILVYLAVAVLLFQGRDVG